MVYVNKREKENTEALIRRFSRKVQASGVLNHVRGLRYFEKEPTREKRRSLAIRGSKIRDNVKYLQKIGRLPEEYGPHTKRRRR